MSNSSSSPGEAPDGAIAVYILRAQATAADQLRQRFKNPVFRVEFIDYNDSDEANDHVYVKKALTHAYANFSDSHVLVIKDSSVTNATDELLANVCYTVTKMGNWDIFYLCKWLDRCDKYRDDPDKKSFDGEQGTYHRTYSPFGIQAMMFTPKTRDILLGFREMTNGKKFELIRSSLDKQLNYEIDQLNLKATSMSPNLFEFDPMRARTIDDYKKLTHCRDEDYQNMEARLKATALSSSSLSSSPYHHASHEKHDGKEDCYDGYWIAIGVIIIIIIIVLIACSCRRRY